MQKISNSELTFQHQVLIFIGHRGEHCLEMNVELGQTFARKPTIDGRSLTAWDLGLMIESNFETNRRILLQ